MRFAAWGTTVHLLTRRPEHLPALREVTDAVLAEVGRACSRFDPDSDLSRVNRHPGEWVVVDPLLVRAVEVAVAAAEVTDGLVDPLLGRPLVQWGYDRDWREIDPAADPGVPGWVDQPRPDAWREIELRPASMRIPADTALDLGSVTKAWAADLIASTHAGEHGTPALVNLGGDLAVAAPDGEDWVVEVATGPSSPAQTAVRITEGGVATSSTQVRRWRRGGVERSHILDPRTNQPVRTPWTLVTVAAVNATAANTAATAAVVLGDAAPAWLTRLGVDARLTDGHDVVRTGRWPADSLHLECTA
jgi:thiamine biosynthesis lipoprotein